MSNAKDIVFLRDVSKVFVDIKQTGIPDVFLNNSSEKAALLSDVGIDLTTVSFGTEDVKNKPIHYLDVDNVIEFYNYEFDRLKNEISVPEEILTKLLDNFFLFRKVKRDVIEKESHGERV